MNNDFDPLDPRRLQERARSVFARAARMQDLHGHALTQANAQRSPQNGAALPGQAPGSFNPETLLAHGAGVAMVNAVNTLNAAAAQAAQLAQADPVIARLNAAINGADVLAISGADVVDVTATEVLAPEHQLPGPAPVAAGAKAGPSPGTLPAH